MSYRSDAVRKLRWSEVRKAGESSMDRGLAPPGGSCESFTRGGRGGCWSHTFGRKTRRKLESSQDFSKCSIWGGQTHIVPYIISTKVWAGPVTCF